MAVLEEAVYNQGRANPIFEQFRVRIAEGEKQRKVDNEELKNRMDNVEKIVGNQNFIVEQNTKQLDVLVRSAFLNPAYFFSNKQRIRSGKT